MARGNMLHSVLGSRVSNEEFKEEGTGINPVVLDDTIEMTAAVEELEAEARDIAVTTNELDQMDNAQSDYTDLTEVLENASNEGGISVESAALLSFFMARDGLDAPVAVSTEAFGNGRSVAQSRVAIESIKETIKGWWAKMKEWITKMWNKLHKWYEKTWAAAPRLKARAEALRKKVTSGNTAPKGNVKIENEGLFKALHINGQFPTNLGKTLDDLGNQANAIFADIPKGGRTAVEGITNAIGDMDFSDATKAAESTNKMITAAAPSPVSEFVRALGLKANSANDAPEWVGRVDKAAFDVFVSDEMPGGKACWATVPKGYNTPILPQATGDNFGESLRQLAEQRFRFDFVVDNKTKKDVNSSGKQIAVPSRNELSSLCDGVINIATSIENYKKDFETQNRTQDALTKAGDRLSNSVSSSEDVKGSGVAISALQTIITACTKLLKEPTTTYAGYFIRTCNSAISFGESALAKYDAKD